MSFVHLNVSLHYALVLHLRRTDDALFSWSGSTQSGELALLANRLERNYLRRLESDRTRLGEFLYIKLIKDRLFYIQDIENII